MDTERKLTELMTRSIREHLVTAEEFIQQVCELERPPANIDLMLGLTEPESATRLWCIPYPYRVPVWHSICKAAFPDREPSPWLFDQLSPDSDTKLVQLVHERANPYIVAALTEDQVSEYDNNNSVGVVLHNISGDVLIYNRDIVSNIEVMAIPISFNKILIEHTAGTSPLSQKDMNSLINFTMANQGNFHVWYKMHFKSHKVPETHWVNMTQKVALNHREVTSIIGYLNACLIQTPKVIILPA